MERCPFDLNKQLRILNYFFSTKDMIANTKKTKVMIIKSKNITYANFVYGNNNLEEVTSYKYHKINIHQKLN